MGKMIKVITAKYFNRFFSFTSRVGCQSDTSTLHACKLF